MKSRLLKAVQSGIKNSPYPTHWRLLCESPVSEPGKFETNLTRCSLTALAPDQSGASRLPLIIIFGSARLLRGLVAQNRS
jgi:hypothetical protein